MARKRTKIEKKVEYETIHGASLAPFKTIKVRSATYARVQDLLRLVSERGWGSIGVERSEPPSLSTVVSEAIEILWSRRT